MEMAGLQVFRPGYGLLPLAEGEKVTLANGDTLRVSVSMQYRGPEQDLTLYGAVGTRVGEGTLSCPRSDTFTPVSGSVDIPIVVNWDAVSAPFVGYQNMLPPGEDYDLYVKIKEHPSIRDELDDIIDLSEEGAGGTPPPPSPIELIGPLLVLVLMVSMMSMMTRGLGE